MSGSFVIFSDKFKIRHHLKTVLIVFQDLVVVYTELLEVKQSDLLELTPSLTHEPPF